MKLYGLPGLNAKNCGGERMLEAVQGFKSHAICLSVWKGGTNSLTPILHVPTCTLDGCRRIQTHRHHHLTLYDYVLRRYR